MHKINVLVADDSGVMRLLISDILKEYPNINVVGTATNGKDAVEKVHLLNPDVLLLDMQMGEYDGKYAVKELMKNKPIPIVLLSAIGNTDMLPILEALELGAYDFLNKPNKNSSKIRDINTQIVQKIEEAFRVDQKKLNQKKSIVNNLPHSFNENIPYDIIVIGASTGGPTAVEKVLTKLPINLPIPVVVVQHMPENFIPSFVKRLNELIPLQVVQGSENTLIKEGRVTIVSGGRNMELKRTINNRIELVTTPEKFEEYNNPSINSIFLSAAQIFKNKTIGVVLTGMGKDGAKGMGAINAQKGLTIAQNEATSVVYGMPREAAEKGYTKFILPINEVGGFIVSSLS